MKNFVLMTALLTGCATADQVKKLQEDVDALSAKVATLEKAPPATAKAATPAANAAAGVDTAAEEAAGAILKDMQTAMGSNDVKTAKAKLAELKAQYPTTRTYKRAEKMGAELEVFDKPAPASLEVAEWLIGDASKVNLQKGVTLLVFWEVWCPHCKREVPNLQKTFETYGPKGLQMVGLTKLSRDKTKEEVMAFLGENKVTYPIAKETGSLSQHFNVSGIPAGAIVKDGVIVWRGHPARVTPEMLDGYLK